MKIDLKSLTIGAIAGIVLILVVGAATKEPPQVGRYNVSAGAGHVIVIAATGELAKHYYANIK
jgi:hypothetical protein